MGLICEKSQWSKGAKWSQVEEPVWKRVLSNVTTSASNLLNPAFAWDSLNETLNILPENSGPNHVKLVFCVDSHVGTLMQAFDKDFGGGAYSALNQIN